MSYTKPLSYSGIKLFKKCPKLWADNYILGNRQPSGPAAERGTMLHDQLEKYYKGTAPFPSHLTLFKRWAPELTKLSFFSPQAELELAVDSNWEPLQFDASDAYVRGKVDLVYWDDQTRVIIDWKSGKEYPEHKDQGKFYFALDAMNTRKADKVVAKMVYLDSNTTLQWEYSPTELDDTIGQIKEDVEYIRSREVYDPTPSMSACNYCPLSWRRGGTCNAAP